MPPTPPQIEAAVSTYVDAWNERSDARRRTSLLEQCLSEDVRIAVAGREIEGRAAVEVEIVEFHRAMPGARGRLSSAIDLHGNVCRFAAVVEGPDGALIAEMQDVCELDARGRIRRIVTFAGAAPPPLAGDPQAGRVRDATPGAY